MQLAIRAAHSTLLPQWLNNDRSHEEHEEESSAGSDWKNKKIYHEGHEEHEGWNQAIRSLTYLISSCSSCPSWYSPASGGSGWNTPSAEQNGQPARDSRGVFASFININSPPGYLKR